MCSSLQKKLSEGKFHRTTPYQCSWVRFRSLKWYHTQTAGHAFSLLSIQMIDGLFFLIQWNVFQGCAWIWPFDTVYCATMWHCFFDWWLYDNVTMSNEDSLRPRINNLWELAQVIQWERISIGIKSSDSGNCSPDFTLNREKPVGVQENQGIQAEQEWTAPHAPGPF